MNKVVLFLYFLLPLNVIHFNSAHAYIANVNYCFTPGQNCTQQIVDRIKSTRDTLYIQAYQFTSEPIKNEVIKAKKRGVKVEVILDKTQCHNYKKKKGSPAELLQDSHIPVWIDKKVSIAHNKVIIGDSKWVISGSFNYSANAQNHNAENVVFIDSKRIAKAYMENWMKREKVSVPLK